MLSREYGDYYWYVFVFPDSSNDPDDRLTTPGKVQHVTTAVAFYQR